MNGKEKLLLTKLVRYAMEHSSPEALKNYLKDHPNADASKHTVKKEDGDSKGQSKGKGGPEKSISVEDAQKAFDKADKAVKDLGLSTGAIADMQSDLKNGLKISLQSRGNIPTGGDEAYELLDNVKSLAGGKSLSDLADMLDKDLADKVKDLDRLIRGADDLEFTPEELKGEMATYNKFKGYNDGIRAVGEAMKAVGIGGRDVQEATNQMYDMMESFERDLYYDFPWSGYKAVSEMTEASKSLASAKAKAPKEEKEEKKEESKPTKEDKAKANKQKSTEEKAKAQSKGKSKGKSKSLDEMSAAELKAQAEEALKNSDMDPEEKKKAIKRMKKKSPADLKAMLSSMGDDEEGGDSGGKKAFLRRSARLGSELKANSVKIARLEAINTLMSEIERNQRRIASLEAQLKKKGGAKDKPKKLSKGTVKIPVKGGHVLLSTWALNHITSHNEVGTGSVFSKAINEKTLIELIQKAPLKGSGGVYELKRSGVGFNLVLPIKEALALPGAVETTVQKDERGEKVTVRAVKTTAPLNNFKTNKVNLVIRPSNPQFLPDDAKANPEIMKDVKDRRSWSLLTAFPGDPEIPLASEWGGHYAVILPS